ncbi:hypothetical protein J3458_000201 [Metarhizium acridum]|uniref:uncharacterized protein n=1 Tax=Metarhizium acridum TaxID=92637 RepID=UPI001C6AE413|nr:hypothetical protein J3458_000201 [Metarhizium acridum]
MDEAKKPTKKRVLYHGLHCYRRGDKEGCQHHFLWSEQSDSTSSPKQQVPIMIEGIVRVHQLFRTKTTRQVAVSLNEPRSARRTRSHPRHIYRPHVFVGKLGVWCGSTCTLDRVTGVDYGDDGGCKRIYPLALHGLPDPTSKMADSKLKVENLRIADEDGVAYGQRRLTLRDRIGKGLLIQSFPVRAQSKASKRTE